jgi:hypothetical protein
MAEMSEVSKFMAEIIRLLTDLVQAVKVNEELMRDTQNVVRNSQSLLESISQSAGMKNIMAANQSLESAITMLQKGVQAMEIHNALRQVQEFLGAMGSEVPSGQVQVFQAGTSSSGAAPQKTSQSKDSLIKPSDLFG